MKFKEKLFLFFMLIVVTSDYCTQAQSYDSASSIQVKKLVLPPTDADSNYIFRYTKTNDIRFLYGGEGTSLAYGSDRHQEEGINTALYNNVSDLIGFGLTYKIIDFDVSYSLPKVRLMEEDRQNLEQFRLALSYTGRKFAIRGFLLNSQGMISVDEGGEFKSAPDVQLLKVGAQLTYYFNEKKYSYRAANFQSELQKKTAGSFLLRFEPSYRYIEAKTGLVPDALDTEATYGNQVGLQSVRAPGLLVLPGYGINVSAFGGKFYISPYVLAGPGFAVNTYRSEKGKYTSLNWEWSAMMMLNMGYNGEKVYANFRLSADTYYIPLNPSYFTTANLKINLTVGYRFINLEKVIPTGFF